jgi:hypothetical protein
MPIPPESSPASGSEPDESLEVCDTDSEYGLGVRTLVRRHKDQVIHRFTGEITHELKQHTLQVGPGRHISGTEIIGYLSHSCDPDCRLDMERSELVALRDIRPGDLLTIDYAETEDVLFRQFACHCGAANCRHWITGRTEPPNAAGRAYLASLTS